MDKSLQHSNPISICDNDFVYRKLGKKKQQNLSQVQVIEVGLKDDELMLDQSEKEIHILSSDTQSLANEVQQIEK